MTANDLVVVWRVTEKCNLGCRFCEYSRHTKRTRAEANLEQVLAFGHVLRDYYAEFGREILVSWLGGEPLLWPPFAMVAHTFKHEFGLRVGVTTNGTALGSELVREQLVQDLDQITISIDGVGGFHDWCREAPGLYERLRENITSLRECKSRNGVGPLIRVNTILMRNNLRQFEFLCRSVAEWGVQQVSFNPLGGISEPGFFASHGLREENIQWLREELPKIRRRMEAIGLEIMAGTLYLQRIVSSIYGIPIPVFDCAPGARYLFVDEQGLIGPCSFTTRGYGFRADEYRSAADLEELPARFAERKREAMLAPCSDCRSTHVFGKFK